MKVRGSYGRTGNAEIGNFASRTLWGANFVGDLAGSVLTQLGVNNLTWENTDQLDLGLEFGLLQDRISGTFEYFEKENQRFAVEFAFASH